MAIRIMNVVGARPNFMKIAPLMEAYARTNEIDPMLVHTGQHYDEKMSDLFFRQLGIPEPDINLGVGSGTHAQQTAQIMARFEPVHGHFDFEGRLGMFQEAANDGNDRLLVVDDQHFDPVLVQVVMDRNVIFM